MAPSFSSLNILFLGPPGSGKDALAEKVAQRYDIAHISSRELLREEVRAGSYHGRKARPSIESGEPVADELMAPLVLRRLDQEDCARGFLFTGFPRNVGQASTLDGILAELGRVIERVFYFDVPEEVLADRLKSAGRLLPDNDDGNNGQRSLDGVIRERIVSYRRTLGSLLDLYRGRGQLLVIDGNRPEEQVSEAVQQVLGMPVGV